MSLPPSTGAWPSAVPPPAYNVVPARTTLKSPPVPANMTLRKSRIEWPEVVKNYVGRAFEEANAVPGISKEEIVDRLKEIIGFFARRGQLNSVDWPTHPLPQDIILEERAAALAQSSFGAIVSSPNRQTNMHAETPLSKKRKSQDGDPRPTNLESRMTYDGPNDKRQKKNAISKDTFSKSDEADREKRKQRFHDPKASSTPPWRSPRGDKADHSSDMSTAPCVGTNMSLEKSYFRLTAPPKPETVRPQHVLEKTLSMLTKKWREEKKYGYICNQFKSLRQDLTVQHIKNAFTVKVYEIHARIALETGDLGEYNQCQTQLKALYAQNLGGNPAEFTAYRILYFVYTCNKTDMNDLLAELTPADKVHPWIKHALDVRSSLALGNYHKFFRLYLEAENMGSYLMDMFIERERLHALANISRAYMNVPLRFLTEELSFESDDACREFLQAHNVQHIVEEKVDDKGGRSVRVKVREAAGVFEGLRQAAFSKVDIKGQI